MTIKEIKRKFFYPVWVSEARVDKSEYTAQLEHKQEEEHNEELNDERSQSEESDEDFAWYDQKLDKSTNFVLVNNNRATFEKGDQVYYCYGNRSNRYLLVNYGFCFQDNRYESYEVNLKLDVDTSDPFIPEMVYFD